ncbi:MAG TPA: hypothetical protein VNI77_07685 [Nitrososphaera sp.]|nr:hypothetical protein [Nitrososphaera sp.]
MALWAINEASLHATVRGTEILRNADLRNDMEMVSDRNLPVAISPSIHDEMCPFDLATAMNSGIKGSKLVRFEKSGHALNIEEKEKTNEELMDFAR